jgi:hypothetical protein
MDWYPSQWRSLNSRGIAVPLEEVFSFIWHVLGSWVGVLRSRKKRRKGTSSERSGKDEEVRFIGQGAVSE